MDSVEHRCGGVCVNRAGRRRECPDVVIERLAGGGGTTVRLTHPGPGAGPAQVRQHLPLNADPFGLILELLVELGQELVLADLPPKRFPMSRSGTPLADSWRIRSTVTRSRAP